MNKKMWHRKHTTLVENNEMERTKMNDIGFGRLTLKFQTLLLFCRSPTLPLLSCPFLSFVFSYNYTNQMRKEQSCSCVSNFRPLDSRTLYTDDLTTWMYLWENSSSFFIPCTTYRDLMILIILLTFKSTLRSC